MDSIPGFVSTRELTDKEPSFEAAVAAIKRLTAAWKDDYNHHRPHGSLGYITPAEFATRSLPWLKIKAFRRWDTPAAAG